MLQPFETFWGTVDGETCAREQRIVLTNFRFVESATLVFNYSDPSVLPKWSVIVSLMAGRSPDREFMVGRYILYAYQMVDLQPEIFLEPGYHLALVAVPPLGDQLVWTVSGQDHHGDTIRMTGPIRS